MNRLMFTLGGIALTGVLVALLVYSLNEWTGRNDQGLEISISQQAAKDDAAEASSQSTADSTDSEESQQQDSQEPQPAEEDLAVASNNQSVTQTKRTTTTQVLATTTTTHPLSHLTPESESKRPIPPPPAVASGEVTAEEYNRALEMLAKANQEIETLQSENSELKENQTNLKEDLNPYQDKVNLLQQGREVLNDFASRFFKYEVLLQGKSFYQFIHTQVYNYVENRDISVKDANYKDPLFQSLKREFMQWVLAQKDQKIRAFAAFVGFHFEEAVYQLPLSLMASSIILELEKINFQDSVYVDFELTPPVRDEMGQLNMDKPAHLEKYSPAQQFFYRRGPKFTEQVVKFFEAYMAFEGI